MTNQLTNLDSIFRFAADKYGSSIAIDDGECCISYSDLDACVDQLAFQLLASGAQSGNKICCTFTKHIPGYVALLACQRVGACWIPLSENLPIQQVSNLISNLTPSHILTEANLLSTYKDVDNNTATRFIVCYVDDQLSVFDCCNRPLAEIGSRETKYAVKPDSPAYIIFTSGSTGSPKGVQVSHKNITKFLHCSVEFFGFEPGKRFAHFSDFNFDPTLFDLFMCWLTGGTLIPFNRRNYRINPLAFLLERTPNVLFTVPSVVHSILSCFKHSNISSCSLTHVLLTGECFGVDLVANIFNSFRDVSVYNMYGTTETAIVSHWYKFSSDISTASMKVVPVGYPLPDITVILADPESPVVSEKTNLAVGECLVSGSQISSGYFNNPDEDSRRFGRFVTERPVTQFYRSGDILELVDGLYYFKGRVDNQVKLLGHRIELEGVEYHLNSHPSVNESVCFLQNDSLQSTLCAVISTKSSNTEISSSILMKFLQAFVPRQMIPTRFFITSKPLPRNHNNKIVRAKINEFCDSI